MTFFLYTKHESCLSDQRWRSKSGGGLTRGFTVTPQKPVEWWRWLCFFIGALPNVYICRCVCMSIEDNTVMCQMLQRIRANATKNMITRMSNDKYSLSKWYTESGKFWLGQNDILLWEATTNRLCGKLFQDNNKAQRSWRHRKQGGLHWKTLD